MLMALDLVDSGTPLRNVAPHVPELRLVRILAVDDDPDVTQLIEIALADARFEHELTVVSTAVRGLAQIADDAHDVYLIDQQLPDGLGLDLIREAKARGASKPFILMTGYGSGTLDEAALDAGAADYVEKHRVTEHLERAIRYALRHWQTGRILHDREEQLRHAQKMEAIGRLAGGVAHDFNNLLTAVIGYTDLLAERLQPGDPSARDVGEIRKAADRATALTRQLLSFSRKQFLNPTVLDLNEVVSGMLHMLPRVIGDHIETATALAPMLGRIRADPSQLEQVLMNLVLNARDAMPSGGRLTITTENVTLTEDRIDAERLRLRPGQYVMLEVSDTGTGMDEDTRAHAFEPFFTTKPKGRGTGLGLATVYGIVDHSGGGIALDTSPGRGTSIRIYLPVTTASGAQSSPPAPVRSSSEDGGTEVVLVVEDNDAVRELARRTLQGRGYVVHDSRTAEDAIHWVEKSRVKPQLLVTDVIMPGLSGPNLAARLSGMNPRLRVLYMSGYTDEATPELEKYWGGVPLLQKPFTPAQLADRVRVALDAPVGSV
jgi:signal transduction histidine kinase